MSSDTIEKFETSVEIPENVNASLKKSMLQVNGPLGKAFKNFKKIPVSLEVNDGKISIKATGHRKKDYAILNTAKSLINKLCEGVNDGYTIKMKIVYAHFPVTVKTKDNKILIENFQGERSPRIAKIHGKIKVAVKGDELTLTGHVYADITQTAAEIQLKTKVKNKDHRVFLDGIYISSKSKGIEK
jgi:large subunit ribosomal protein L6